MRSWLEINRALFPSKNLPVWMPDRVIWSWLVFVSWPSSFHAKHLHIFSEDKNIFRLLIKVMLHGTIFSAKQHCNIVATLIQMVATLFQHWNAVLRKKSLLRIVPCNITLRVTIAVFYGGFNATTTKLWEILILIQANFLENITWSVLGKQNIQAKKVHCLRNRWGAEVSD